MSQEEISNVSRAFASIDKLITWMKAMLIGAFALGVWATTLQLKINQNAADIAQIQADRRDALQQYQLWQTQISTDIANTRTDVATTRTNVEWIRQELQKRP